MALGRISTHIYCEVESRSHCDYCKSTRKSNQIIYTRITLSDAIKGIIELKTHRLSLFAGLFSFIWKLVNNTLAFNRKRDGKLNSAIAGGIAGLAILVETRENRVDIAQQLLARSMQAGYNALHTRQLLTLPHGDSFLFAISTASILYAYTMHPYTIPKECEALLN